MNSKQLFLLIAFFLSLEVFGQNDVGFKANIISSFIPFKDVSRYQLAWKDQKYMISPSGQVGMFYCHKFKNHSFLETDLLFNQVESRTSYTPNMQYDQGSNVNYQIQMLNNGYFEENRMHLSYLSLPVYYGYNAGRCSFLLGFQTSLKLGTSYTIISHNSGTTSSNGSEVLTNIDNFDYGPKIGFTWRASTYLDLEGTYYYGINNITHDPFNAIYQEWRIRQISIGIRYILTRNK